MTRERQRTTVRVDGDGVKSIETAGVRPGVWIAAAVLIAICIGFVLLRPASMPDETLLAANDSAAPQPAKAEPPQRAQPPAFKPIRRAEPADVPVRPADAPPQPAAERSDDIGDTDSEESDAPTGIALFPPPGTDPLKRGLLVPEDFELPPGYVRHYQATDDGQRVPAILMFHPDYDWVDEQGRHIDVPPDGIVPPELAPAGLPLQMLDPPDIDIPLVEEPGPGETATD